MIMLNIYMDHGFFDNGYQLNKHTATQQRYQGGFFTFTPVAIEQNILILNLALHTQHFHGDSIVSVHRGRLEADSP
jgi:hypothetical protein